MAIFKTFFRAYFTIFLSFLLLVNLMLFATTLTGTHPLGLTYNVNRWDFNNYYFGFYSLTSAFKDLGNLFVGSNFLNSAREFLSAVNVFAPLSLGGTDLISILMFIANLLTAPVNILAGGLKLLAYTLNLTIRFVDWFYSLMMGYYNLPLP